MSINTCFSEPKNVFGIVFVSFSVALLEKGSKNRGKTTSHFSGLCLVIEVSGLSYSNLCFKDSHTWTASWVTPVVSSRSDIKSTCKQLSLFTLPLLFFLLLLLLLLLMLLLFSSSLLSEVLSPKGRSVRASPHVRRCLNLVSQAAFLFILSYWVLVQRSTAGGFEQHEDNVKKH